MSEPSGKLAVCRSPTEVASVVVHAPAAGREEAAGGDVCLDSALEVASLNGAIHADTATAA